MKTAVCLQHVPFEGAGYLQRILADHGYCLQKQLVPEQGLPATAGDFLLVMGGPMSVNDAEPWIAQETAFIRQAVQHGIPYLGICLGSQFLAKAMGGGVYGGPATEIGMTTLRRTAEGAADAAFRHFPETFEAFAWHGEGILLPPDAVPLARSELFPVQAFRCGTRAYGLLFHVEIEPDGVAELCRHCENDLARTRRTPAEVEADVSPHFPLMQDYLRNFMQQVLR